MNAESLGGTNSSIRNPRLPRMPREEVSNVKHIINGSYLTLFFNGTHEPPILISTKGIKSVSAHTKEDGSYSRYSARRIIITYYKSSDVVLPLLDSEMYQDAITKIISVITKEIV